MTVALFVAGVVLAVAVAVRSTWSPCGVSMLSTLTPMSEAARGHRFWVTAVWYTLGGLLGGIALGLAVAPVAALVGWAQPQPLVGAGFVAAAAILAMATDLRLTGWRLPGHTRQVDENWITTYRPWVYATGFGAQIGFGLVTVIMTGALYLLVVVMALTGDPLAAVALGGLFGLVRGAAIWVGFRLDRPAALRRFHQRFEALAPASIALMVVVETAVLILMGAVAGLPAAGVAIAGLILVPFAIQQHRRRVHREPSPLTLPVAVDRLPA